MAEQYTFKNIHQVFPEGDIYVVTDDERLGAAACGYGFKCIQLANLDAIPPAANVIVLIRGAFVSVELRKALGTAKVLVIPLASFDQGLETALYTLEMVVRTDYVAACRRNLYWANSLAGDWESLVFSAGRSGNGATEQTSLVCTLGDDVQAETCLTPLIDVGQWVSIGTYCEFAVVAGPGPSWDSFTIDGTAVASGMLVAEDARASHEGIARCRAARELRAAMVPLSPITLRLEAGVLISARACGRDFREELLQVTNPEYGLHATELGIGTNQALLPWVNLFLNSQLNEGAGPVHIGFGEGLTGAHIDFVMSEGEHRFKSAAA